MFAALLLVKTAALEKLKTYQKYASENYWFILISQTLKFLKNYGKNSVDHHIA